MFDAAVIGLLVACLYSYLVYPAALLVVIAFRRSARARPFSPLLSPPSATLIVAVHNGGRAQVRRKVEEARGLKQHLPSLQVIFASDCSTDDTDVVLATCRFDGMEVVRLAQRGGKEAAQAAALRCARGVVIVFSDIAAQVEPQDFERLMGYFSDPAIGAVSSCDRLLGATSTGRSEGLYLRYEMAMRALESRAAGLIGMSGALFAVRRECCDPWDTGICSDFNVALNVSKSACRAISADDVVVSYTALKSATDEVERRVRTIARGMAGLSKRHDILDPRGNFLFAFQVFSHKVMRWLVPWFFLALFLLLATRPELSAVGTAVLLGQGLLAAAWLLSVAIPGLRALPGFHAIPFLVESNIAAFRASLRFLQGDRVRTWEPSRR